MIIVLVAITILSIVEIITFATLETRPLLLVSRATVSAFWTLLCIYCIVGFMIHGGMIQGGIMLGLLYFAGFIVML